MALPKLTLQVWHGTQEEIRERARIPMAAFLADVTSALESANGDDKVKIRQLLSEAKTGLKVSTSIAFAFRWIEPRCARDTRLSDR